MLARQRLAIAALAPVLQMRLRTQAQEHLAQPETMQPDLPALAAHTAQRPAGAAPEESSFQARVPGQPRPPMPEMLAEHLPAVRQSAPIALQLVAPARYLLLAPLASRRLRLQCQCDSAAPAPPGHGLTPLALAALAALAALQQSVSKPAQPLEQCVLPAAFLGRPAHQPTTQPPQRSNPPTDRPAAPANSGRAAPRRRTEL